jgi:phosphohistidine swiveling domain-containing protein
MRKAGHSKAVFLSYSLFQAIADRLQIDVVSLRRLVADEMIAALKKGSVSPENKKVILGRLDFFVGLLRNGELKFYGGQEAKDFYGKEVLPFLPSRDTKEIKGTSAMPGLVRGKVRLVRLESQAELVQDGEILVSSMTDPDMVPAMKKAAAIVTDEGGMLCHAAIISRELKKPCVIGTQIATQVLKDGDEVEVDATTGIVRKLG